MLNSRINVGVLRGGPSSEYFVSLDTGASVIKHMPSKYNARDIFVSKDGVWHLDGFERSPEKSLRAVDVVFNAMHGQYGEDGAVQGLMKNFGIKHTGSEVLPSAMAMNKNFAKDILRRHDIQTPASVLIRSTDNLEGKIIELFEKVRPPFIVKPLSLGSSVGVTIANDFSEAVIAIDTLFPISDAVIVEEFISGREATCAVVDKFKGRDIYALPPVEICPAPGSVFFDFNSKYGGGSEKICPSNFTGEERRQIERVSTLIHRELGLRHYSRSDFIVSPERGVFFLEVNALPGLTSESLLPKSLHVAGSSLPEFIDHVLDLTLKGK